MGPNQIDDLVHSIQQSYIMGKWQDISSPLQNYQFAARIFDRAKKKEMSSTLCKWKLKIANNDNFQVVDLYHRDTSTRVDVLTEGEMKWGMTTTNYHYDIDEDIFNQGTKEIVNHFNLQEDGLMQDFFEGVEDLMFASGPASSSVKPFPITSLLWWITTTAEDSASAENTATEGFTGYSPQGWSNAGGISPTTYKQWRNRCFPYTTVSSDDLIKKTIRSMDLCSFKPPVPRHDIKPEGQHNWELLTTYSRLEKLRTIARLNNDNTGNEVASNSGTIEIRGVPVNWVSAWTNESSVNQRDDGVLLGVDWNTFDWYYNSKRHMRKHDPFQHHEMSNVRVRKMEDAGQIVCYNRRANFRGYCTDTVTETT